MQADLPQVQAAVIPANGYPAITRRANIANATPTLVVRFSDDDSGSWISI
jgi:hypothetical protein